MKSYDDLVRSTPAWGCWRSRQALKCAAVAVRLMGRSEDKAALHDAVLLLVEATISAQPARCFWPPIGFPPENPPFSSKAVAEFAYLLGLAWDDRLTVAVEHANHALQSCRPAPFAEADLSRPSMPRGRMPNRLPGGWLIR